jgi:oxygen-independent coproporphyrinogen-3 oxidase
MQVHRALTARADRRSTGRLRFLYHPPREASWQALRRSAADFIGESRGLLERAAALGIGKDLFQKNSSHIVVTYPARQDLGPVDPAEIFARRSGFRTRGRTLYVHIPFCAAICTYCGFARTAASDTDPRIGAYLDALDRESELMRDALGFDGVGRVPVSSVYIGGGTPSLLNVADLERLLRTLHRDFALAQGGELTLEVSPETVTEEKLRLARQHGVNRVSMGVESFDDAMLASVRRRHDAQAVRSVIALLRSEGFKRIDIDLIRNLPGSTEAVMERDIRSILELQLPSVTSYEYVMKPQSIDLKRYGNGTLEVVDRNDAAYVHLLFCMAMETMGYGQRPLGWHLREEADAYRQQVEKWESGFDLIPLGMSAYGYVNGVQFINHRDFNSYRAAIGSGRLPIAAAAVLDEVEQAHRQVVFGLRTEVDRERLVEDYGVDIFSECASTARTFAEHAELQLIETTGYSKVRLSPLGALFQDQMQMAYYSPAYRKRAHPARTGQPMFRA